MEGEMEGRKEGKKKDRRALAGAPGADTGGWLEWEGRDEKGAGASLLTLTSSGAPHPGLALGRQRQALTKRRQRAAQPSDLAEPGAGGQEKSLPCPGPPLTELGAREVCEDAEGTGLARPRPRPPVLCVLHQPLLAGVWDQRSERLSVGRVWLRTAC